jgi:hypothetical protein
MTLKLIEEQLPVNQQIGCQILHKFLEKGKRSEQSLFHIILPASSSCHDNETLPNKSYGTVKNSYTPYSPDLTPANIFLFPTVKATLNDRRYKEVKRLENGITTTLNAVLFNPSHDCFVQLPKPYKVCCCQERLL